MKRTTIGLRVIGVILVLTLSVWGAPVMGATHSQNAEALAWLRAAQEPDGGFSSGFAEGSDLGTTVEVILAAAAAGEDVSTWVTDEGRSPLDYVATQVASSAVTDVGNLGKVILVAVATGQDPRSFAGEDLIEGVKAEQDPETGLFGDTLFKHAYVVLALHNARAAVPESAVTAMTSQFTEDGGWALFGGTTPGTADTNTTALVMQALVAVGRPDSAAGALPYLQRMQNEDGGFPYQKPSAWGTETDANSTAVVLQALNALDESLGTWVANGTDPLGALLAMWDPNTGAYRWQQGVPSANMLATAQAIQAGEGMTLVDIARVGAARSPEVAVSAEGTALLPASGARLDTRTALVMGGVIVMVAVSAFLRRK